MASAGGDGRSGARRALGASRSGVASLGGSAISTTEDRVGSSASNDNSAETTTRGLASDSQTSSPHKSAQTDSITEGHSPTLAERLAVLLAEKGPPAFPDLAKGNTPKGTSAENIEVFLKWAGLAVKRDTFARQTLIEGIPGHSRWDDDALFIVRVAANRTGLNVSSDLLHDVVREVAGKRRWHPVRDYLDACEAQWDGVARIDHWLSTYAGVAGEPGDAALAEYISAVGALFLVAAVHRVRKPGCKFDTLLVLEGRQGAGKSSVCRTLVPDANWFSDCLPLGAEPKVVIEMTTGRWICEFAELTGISRREVEEIKVFLSRQSDAARAAYGREPNERFRQFVSVGTTNDDKYLIDGTGNRRFLPVRVSGEIDLEGLLRDRGQLWGEAARRERTIGSNLFLPVHLWDVAARQQEERRIVGPIELALEDALGAINSGFIASRELNKIVSLRAGQGEARHVKLIAEAMRRLGWEKDRRSGKHIWRTGPEWQAKEWAYSEEHQAVVSAERARRSAIDDTNTPAF
jgi:hypothetical protein